MYGAALKGYRHQPLMLCLRTIKTSLLSKKILIICSFEWLYGNKTAAAGRAFVIKLRACQESVIVCSGKQ